MYRTKIPRNLYRVNSNFILIFTFNLFSFVSKEISYIISEFRKFEFLESNFILNLENNYVYCLISFKNKERYKHEMFKAENINCNIFYILTQSHMVPYDVIKLTDRYYKKTVNYQNFEDLKANENFTKEVNNLFNYEKEDMNNISTNKLSIKDINSKDTFNEDYSLIDKNNKIEKSNTLSNLNQFSFSKMNSSSKKSRITFYNSEFKTPLNDLNNKNGLDDIKVIDNNIISEIPNNLNNILTQSEICNIFSNEFDINHNNNKDLTLQNSLLQENIDIDLKYDDSFIARPSFSQNAYYQQSDESLLQSNNISVLLSQVKSNNNNIFNNSQFTNLNNSQDYENDILKEEVSTLPEFVLINIEHILQMAIDYKFLFSEEEKDIILVFKNSLEYEDKQILLKFLTGSSVWVLQDKLKKKFENLEVEKIIAKLENLKLINGFEYIFDKYNEDVQKENFKSELFTFLNYLSNHELKIINTQLSKMSKHNSKQFNNEELVTSKILMNNSFYNLKNYMDSQDFEKICENCSEKITKFNFSLKSQNDGLIYTPQKNSKSQFNFPNLSNYKKVKISRFSFPSRMISISLTVKSIENFLKDKSSSVMDNFLNLFKSKSDNSLSRNNSNISSNLNDKLNKVKKIFKDLKCFSLNPLFAKVFDCASRLFFFYSDYKDINDVAKEYYRYENFEKFDNFVLNKQFLKEDKDYLQPIFTDVKGFKLYDNLYQIKSAYIINSIIFNNTENDFQTGKELLFVLLKLLNEDLFNFIFKIYLLMDNKEENINQVKKEIWYQNLILRIENLEFHDKLLEKLLSKDVNSIEDTFLDKFRYNHIASELLHYFAENCEKLKKHNLAVFVYLFLLTSNYLAKRRGFWWLRVLIDYNKYIKNISACCKLLNKAFSDKHIPHGFLIKIKGFYERFLKIKEKNDKAVEQIEQKSRNSIKKNNSKNNIKTKGTKQKAGKNNKKKSNKSKSDSEYSFSEIDEDLNLKENLNEIIEKEEKQEEKEEITTFENIDSDVDINENIDSTVKDLLECRKIKYQIKISKKREEIEKKNADNPTTNTSILLPQSLKEYDLILDIDISKISQVKNTFQHTTITGDSVYNKNSGRRLYNVNDVLCSVETFALHHYEKLNYQGVHGENAILPALYNIFFWDIIYYDKVPLVFQSPYQYFPLDLFYFDFYKSREEIIQKRVNEIANYSEKDLSENIDFIFTFKKNIKTVFINWNRFYNEKSLLLKIATAITPKKLSLILLEFSKNLKYMLKGMPDLFLWKEESLFDSALLVEVKSKNDHLSEFQEYWLTFLTNVGLNVQVLHIK